MCVSVLCVLLARAHRRSPAPPPAPNMSAPDAFLFTHAPTRAYPPVRPAPPCPAANYAVCCPSRTTILTGLCAHNSGVVGAGYGPLGGFDAFVNSGNEQRTAPLFLKELGGYRTGLIGK